MLSTIEIILLHAILVFSGLKLLQRSMWINNYAIISDQPRSQTH